MPFEFIFLWWHFACTYINLSVIVIVIAFIIFLNIQIRKFVEFIFSKRLTTHESIYKLSYRIASVSDPKCLSIFFFKDWYFCAVPFVYDKHPEELIVAVKCYVQKINWKLKQYRHRFCYHLHICTFSSITFKRCYRWWVRYSARFQFY